MVKKSAAQDYIDSWVRLIGGVSTTPATTRKQPVYMQGGNHTGLAHAALITQQKVG